MRVSRVPMVKTSTESAARTSAWAKARCACVRSFIEPETSMRTTMRRCRSRRRRRRSRTNSPAWRMASRNMRRASVPSRRAPHASDSRAAAARAPAARARNGAAFRLRRRARSGAPKAAPRRSPCAPDSRVSSPKIGSGPTDEFLGRAQRLFVARLRLQPGHDRAKKMRIEQRVEFGETLRRRRERCARGAADVADFRGPRSSIAASQAIVCSGATAKPARRSSAAKPMKWAMRARCVAHACASARMASILGAM